jgi:hypothetical protein
MWPVVVFTMTWATQPTSPRAAMSPCCCSRGCARQLAGFGTRDFGSTSPWPVIRFRQTAVAAEPCLVRVFVVLIVGLASRRDPSDG